MCVVETLLIVDDEEHQRLLYQEELSEEGYQVILAGNGKEALERLSESVPDLIVLDIRMPIMNGLEALGKIIGKEKGIPVIIHSAYSSYKDDFMSWAADDFVVKSSDLTELKRKIRELLDKKKAER
jgi:DNA-binding NtrC family response regulator